VRRVLRYQALDGADVTFPVPKGVNHYLAAKAIDKAHRGMEPDLVDFGLTEGETRFVAEVVAKLEEHKAKAAVS